MTLQPMPRCARLRSRAGLTLIEVVAGLALMATIVASLLYARTRYTTSLARADLELRAARAADALLHSWEQFPSSPAQGAVPGDSKLRWRTATVRNREADALRARVGRLEIIRSGLPAAPPLVRLEVLIPAERKRRDD